MAGKYLRRENPVSYTHLDVYKRQIQFDISIEAEKDTEAWLIPIAIYKDLLERSAVVANYTNEVMSSRFTDVMWLMEQILWKSFDRRLAGFLLEEAGIEGSVHLKITHEQIASHLGTAREVVSRMLKYFRDEGMITLMRGAVELTDMEKPVSYTHLDVYKRQI